MFFRNQLSFLHCCRTCSHASLSSNIGIEQVWSWNHHVDTEKLQNVLFSSPTSTAQQKSQSVQLGDNLNGNTGHLAGILTI
jgi:hypothetical protein